MWSEKGQVMAAKVRAMYEEIESGRGIHIPSPKSKFRKALRLRINIALTLLYDALINAVRALEDEEMYWDDYEEEEY